MKNIRKLYLQNAAGDRYGLNGERGAYASNLASLGFTLSPSYADLYRGFYVPVADESEPQNAVPFTLTFTKAPYASYKTFLDWLAAAGTITLIYNPTGNQEYCRDVNVNFLQKGELNAVGWLEIPCSFYCITPWYLPTPASLVMESSGEDESKRYDYEYTDELRYGTDSSASLSGTIAGAGHVPGSLELAYRGAITNPKIRLTGNISGKTYGLCSVTVQLADTDELRYSSRYEESYVKRVAADGTVTDLLDAIDLSSTPFFHIPVDEPCTISVEADTTFKGYVDILIYYYFRSV